MFEGLFWARCEGRELRPGFVSLVGFIDSVWAVCKNHRRSASSDGGVEEPWQEEGRCPSGWRARSPV
jgi:hypothetical protein